MWSIWPSKQFRAADLTAVLTQNDLMTTAARRRQAPCLAWCSIESFARALHIKNVETDLITCGREGKTAGAVQ